MTFKYQHIARYVAETLWAIQPSKMAELLSVLAYRAAGHEFTADELKARLGEGTGTSTRATGSGAIAVIPIHGVIAHRMGGMDESSGGTSAERIGKTIDRIAADPQIGTIVYDINSSGGTVPGIQELAAQMFALRGQKKQVAQIDHLAASAAYWLASQADEIVSIPSGMAGSIGVYSVHEDLSAALEKEGIKVTLISAGTHKVAGNPFEPLSAAERGIIQARVDVAYAQFVKDVARGRGVTAAAVRNGYGEGRALSAVDAKAAGLIDRIATMEDTIGRLVGRKPAGGLRAGGDWIDEDADVTPPRIDDPRAVLSRAVHDTLADAERARRRRLL